MTQAAPRGAEGGRGGGKGREVDCIVFYSSQDQHIREPMVSLGPCGWCWRGWVAAGGELEPGLEDDYLGVDLAVEAWVDLGEADGLHGHLLVRPVLPPPLVHLGGKGQGSGGGRTFPRRIHTGEEKPLPPCWVQTAIRVRSKTR